MQKLALEENPVQRYEGPDSRAGVHVAKRPGIVQRLLALAALPPCLVALDMPPGELAPYPPNPVKGELPNGVWKDEVEEEPFGAPMGPFSPIEPQPDGGWKLPHI